ncbi:alpha-ketoacid dehydrogenase subunit beta [Streptomyces sp. TR1341]|uniref:transketolase C-terminal domain-containing protein n=1 Tax=Streptomyces sp. TR1341 TaxID=2601266 RepID=UPI00138AC4B2|nr:alpha-ketoacid dehydrogenase subunit beta [Streptomyces sp. TR1341]
MSTVTMVQALNRALHDAMAEDERVLAFGEDVGHTGGLFGVTAGLARTFGPGRCYDSPTAESGILGTAVGMAMYGRIPVVEVQYDAYLYPAFEQLVSHVAKLRNRTRGKVALPIVLRVPYGGIGTVEHHNDSSEAYYAHTPGLHVVAPATVADAYGLLREAIAAPDPVVFLEPKRLYTDTADLELPVRTEPIGRAVVRRPGNSATVLAYGPAVPTALAAAEAARDRGYDLEVVDLRTLVPFDDETVRASVRRTRYAVVVHEASGFAGVGAEIAARITEACFDDLLGPVQRVTGLDIPYPPPKLQHHHLPDAERIVEAVERLYARGAQAFVSGAV